MAFTASKLNIFFTRQRRVQVTPTHAATHISHREGYSCSGNSLSSSSSFCSIFCPLLFELVFLPLPPFILLLFPFFYFFFLLLLLLEPFPFAASIQAHSSTLEPQTLPVTIRGDVLMQVRGWNAEIRRNIIGLSPCYIIYPVSICTFPCSHLHSSTLLTFLDDHLFLPPSSTLPPPGIATINDVSTMDTCLYVEFSADCRRPRLLISVTITPTRARSRVLVWRANIRRCCMFHHM